MRMVKITKYKQICNKIMEHHKQNKIYVKEPKSSKDRINTVQL